MKKTRILILVLLLLCALTLSACDTKKNDDKSSDNSNVTSGDNNTVCAHEYENNVCTKCGASDPNYSPECVHSYDSGVCTKCGTADPNYNPECVHNYVSGVCDSCGAPCGHKTYTNGKCAECGTECDHKEYENSVCTVCKIPCTHSSYEDGSCEVCGKACAHNYVDGTCKICGADDPEFVPDASEKTSYEDIIEKFEYLILYKYVNQELPEKDSDAPDYVDVLYEIVESYDPSMDMGYAIKDINNDSVEELVLMQSDSHIHALFTMVNDEVKLVYVFQDGMGYLTPDGTVFYNHKYWNASGVNVQSALYVSKLVNGELVGIEYGWIDDDDDPENEDKYYSVSLDGTRTELTKSEYNLVKAKYEYFWDYPTRLTKLSGLVFHSALLDSSDATVTADFSTYDAVIKTFGLIHSIKFVRSYWISGHYDKSMLFESDEDFEIYNRLLASCVLIRNDKNDTFGFAKKDLNGDGTDELVLLEGTQHNVLAIFTEIDGKAVLLDTYTDLRQAFIDANGLIHVKETVIPGYKTKDALYTVYEIKNGELSCKLSIGEEYRQKGSYSSEAYKWYKIEGGNRVEISQDDWNTLYAEYALDIGTTKYNVYTQNNAGLTFIQVPVA